MIAVGGFFGVTGAIAGAALLTTSLMSGGTVPLFAAIAGIIGGGAAGGIAGGVVDMVINTITAPFLGGFHHNPEVRKLQRESRNDGNPETDLGRREAENRYRQMNNDERQEQLRTDWAERIKEQREAVEQGVYTAGRGSG